MLLALTPELHSLDFYSLDGFDFGFGYLMETEERGVTPFFRSVGGAVVSTGDVLVAVRLLALAAGEDPASFGAHSLRIGGATDYVDRFGLTKAPILIAKRGRWDSDIGEIYARAAGAIVIDASVESWEAEGPELEAVISGFGQAWAEPGR